MSDTGRIGAVWRRAAAMACAAMAVCAPAPARDIYVSATAAPGGDGTITAPYADFADLAHALVSGDTVYLRGVFRGQGMAFESIENVTFTKWPGDAERPVIRSDTPIPPSAFTFDQATGFYVATVDSEPLDLVWNWDINIDSSGRHYGHLLRGPFFPPLGPGQWRYDGGPDGGRVYVNPPTQAIATDPSLGLDTYSVVHEGSGLYIFGLDSNVTIRDINFALWPYTSAQLGYGVRLENASNCLVEDCRFDDCGKHSVGFAGASCAGNVMRRLECRGLAGSVDGGAGHLVFYSLGGDVTGCVAEDCELHLYTYLNYADRALFGSCAGCFSHAASGALVRDVQWRRIHCYDYAGNVESAFGSAPETTLPADRASANPAEYPVRFIECTLSNGARLSVGSGPGSLATSFERCTLNFARARESGAWAIGVQGDDARALFESCVIVADGSGMTSTEARLFDVPPTSTLVLSGCVVQVAGALGGGCAHIRQDLLGDSAVFPNSMIVATQTVFSREAPGSLHKGNNQMSAANLASSLRLRDCWYWNIAPGQYSLGNTAIAAENAWEAVVDPTGVYDSDPGFIDPANMNFEGAAAGALRTTARVLPMVQRVGINRRAYSGHFGAYQYMPLGDFDGDGRVSSQDLAILLGSWGGCPESDAFCPWDLNGDGMVGSPDLALLLGGWTP